MACTITSLFLIAMFGIIAAGMVFRPSSKEKPSAQRQDTPVAPSGDRVIVPKEASARTIGLTAFEPMTLSNMRANGARWLGVSCCLIGNPERGVIF